MANGMEGLYIGNAGLLTAQNAINTVANNIANVNSKGYVRQQVILTDNPYNFVKSAAIGNQTVGLGVSMGEIVHARDNFLDKSYRIEASRQAYYDSYHGAIDEVQGLYQELDGEAFKDVLTGDSSLWTAFQQLAQDPSDSVNQNMVIQKSNLLLTRANAIYSSLSKYQSQINVQISNDIDRANELGKEIEKLNHEIQAIEAGGFETAYDLRDARDNDLDELSALLNITYEEDLTGIVRVKAEGQYFVDETKCYPIGKQTDRATGFITPYWPYLSNESTGSYFNLFDFSQGVSTEANTDLGEIKALIQARGNVMENYTAIEGVDADVYSATTGLSIMEQSQAQVDQLIHGITTAINDIVCPNTTASFDYKVTNTDGSYTIYSYHDIKVLDEENCNTGADGKLPPNEIFTRVGTERYTAIKAEDGHTYYVYNAEDIDDSKTLNVAGTKLRVWDSSKGNGTVTVTNYKSDGTVDGKPVIGLPYEQYDTEKTPKYKEIFVSGKSYYVLNEDYSFDSSTQYTLSSLGVNDTLESQITLFPYQKRNGEIDYAMGKRLADVWNQNIVTLYPNSSAKFSFSDYYTEMIGGIASLGSTYQTTSETLYNSCTALDNQRLQVTGVSADEELVSMVKFQNAYNAASRYIQVVSEMIEQVVTSMGA